MNVGTICPHCKHSRTDADDSTPAWVCPACGRKYYESDPQKGLFERAYDRVFVTPPEKFPSVWPCKACNKKVSREAVVCPHCGQPDPYEYKQAGVPFAKTSTANKAGALILLGMAIFLGVTIVHWMVSPAEPDHSEASAMTVCQFAVKQRVKSPSSAKFSGHDAYGSGDSITVKGIVEAQNVFGAMIQTSYKCDLTKTKMSWGIRGVEFY